MGQPHWRSEDLTAGPKRMDFDNSLFNNVTLWAENTEKNLQKFWKVIKKAVLFDFVVSLPEKENEVFRNNGINLSG